MSNQPQLTAADGHRFNAYLAQPSGRPRGGIVVLQEIFGVNSHIRDVADAYAAAGYLAIAPALFDRVRPNIELGYTGDDMKEGVAIRAQCANDKTLLDIETAILHVAGAGKVGAVGYCWGGSLAWLSACSLDGLSAGVSYYGSQLPALADKTARCPFIAHFGEKDHGIPLEGVDKFKAAQPNVPVYVYAADHGFNCDQRASYDAAAAKLARERTLAFFAQHLG
jgi:carboxymethylenebutenolidase